MGLFIDSVEAHFDMRFAPYNEEQTYVSLLVAIRARYAHIRDEEFTILSLNYAPLLRLSD